MRQFRFNIAGLLIFILVCGVAFASLKKSSEIWESAVFSLTLVVLMISVLLAIHRTGASKHFWVGFALFGSCYLGLSLIPPVEARLISSKGLAFFHSRLPGQSPDQVTGAIFGWKSQQQTESIAFSADGRKQGFVGIWDASTGKLIGRRGSSVENFVKIGHSWLTVLAALLGGLLSRRLSRRSAPSVMMGSPDDQSKAERAEPCVS